MRNVALVTGASSGIGQAFAERLARDGHDLVVVARRRDRLEALAETIRSKDGVQVEVLTADLASSAGIASTEARLGAEANLALLVNNAGFAGYMPFSDLPRATANELIDVHVRAATLLTQAALPPMLARGAGAVVNVASLLAFSGSFPPGRLPPRAVYGACKAYLVAFSQLLEQELTGTSVQVQVLCPGVVDSEFHDSTGLSEQGRANAMSPEDVVQASLSALGTRELLCAPGLDDPGAVDAFNTAAREVMAGGFQPHLASRYRPMAQR